MFLFIMFLVYSSSTFDMVMIDNEFMYMFAKRLALFTGELRDRWIVCEFTYRLNFHRLHVKIKSIVGS
jgi:hypothetical protein